MRILIGKTDITSKLALHNGEYATVELSCGKKKKCWGGTLTVIPDEIPYNPLMDGGTDAMLGGRV
jgi:hypothetical protein